MGKTLKIIVRLATAECEHAPSAVGTLEENDSLSLEDTKTFL